MRSPLTDGQWPSPLPRRCPGGVVAAPGSDLSAVTFTARRAAGYRYSRSNVGRCPVRWYTDGSHDFFAPVSVVGR